MDLGPKALRNLKGCLGCWRHAPVQKANSGVAGGWNYYANLRVNSDAKRIRTWPHWEPSGP